MNIYFKDYSNRKKDIFLINPIPSDNRFNPLKANYNLLSKALVYNPPLFGNYADRPVVFPPKDVTLMYNVNYS